MSIVLFYTSLDKERYLTCNDKENTLDKNIAALKKLSLSNQYEHIEVLRVFNDPSVCSRFTEDIQSFYKNAINKRMYIFSDPRLILRLATLISSIEDNDEWERCDEYIRKSNPYLSLSNIALNCCLLVC